MVVKLDKIALPCSLPPLPLFHPGLLFRWTPEKSGPFCRRVKKPYKEKAEICGQALHEYNTCFDFVFWYVSLFKLIL